MTKDVSVVITGSSGFIGRSFIESYSNLDLYRTKRKKNNQISFEHIKSSSESDCLDIDNDFVLLHLATYFSKNVEDKSLITNANIDFGENLINKLQNSKIKKIVYTNTMFNFYKDTATRNLYYTKTKQMFSEYLKEVCKEKSILYEEIYLDNTFGKSDTRKKVIPLIINSILNNQKNPIENPDVSLNLVSVDDVCKRLYQATFDNKNDSSLFIQKKSFELRTIYEYLNAFKEHNMKDYSLIKLKPNNYIDSLGFNNQNNYQLKRVYDQLLQLVQ